MQRPLLLSITAGVLFILLTPLVVADGNLLPNSFFPFIVPKAVYARSIIVLVFGLWVALALLYPEYRPPRSWVLAIFAIHLAVGFLATAFSVSPQRSLWSTYERMQGMVDLAYWFALSLVIASVFRTMANWRMLLNANLAVSIVVALIGVAEHYGLEVLPYLTHAPRVKASLGNPTYVGAFTMVNILIGVGFLGQSFFSQRQVAVAPQAPSGRRRRGRERRPPPTQFDWVPVLRIYWAVAAFLNLWVFTMAGSRGAALGLVVGVLAFASVYLWTGRVKVVRYASAAVLGVVVLLAVLLVVGRDSGWYDSLASSNILIRRLSSVSVAEENTRGRVNSWKAGLRGFADRPLLGWGPENYTVAYDKYIGAETFSGSAESFDQAHNKLLEEATTKGVVGFLTYCALWVAMTRAVAGHLRDWASPENLLVWFVGAALVSYFVQNLFLFDTPATILQFILLMTFTANLGSTFKEESAGAKRSDTVETGAPAAELSGRVAELRQAWASSTAGVGLRSFLTQRVEPDRGTAWALVAGVLVLAAIAIYLFGFRVYNGASKVLQTANPNITWVERLDLFEESIGSFDQLGNYPRLVMFNQLETNWQNLTIHDAQVALEIVEVQGDRAFTSEPREWRSLVTLANFYHVAALIGPTYADRAQTLVQASADQIPEEFLNSGDVQVSEILESDWSGASEVTRLYLDLLTQAHNVFEELRPGQINAVLRQLELTAIEAAEGDAQQWRVPVSLALTYGRAAELGGTYLNLARSYIEQAKELAPGRVEVYQALARQHLAESDPEGASKTVDEYLEMSPGSDIYFGELRAEIESRMEAANTTSTAP